MIVYVYTPFNYCIQKKELISLVNIFDCYGKYNIVSSDNFIIKDAYNSIIYRVLFFITGALGCSLGPSGDSAKLLIKERKIYKKKNKNIIGFLTPSLFHLKGEIEFKQIDCNENTVLKVFRTKGEFPFYYEVQNGEVEVVYNGKRRKRKKINTD